MVPEASHHVRAPFRAPPSRRIKSKSSAREKNRRVVFRALVNARIIAMATREFAWIGSSVLPRQLTMSIRISLIFNRGSQRAPQKCTASALRSNEKKKKIASLIHKYSYCVKNLSIPFFRALFFFFFKSILDQLVNRIQKILFILRLTFKIHTD